MASKGLPTIPCPRCGAYERIGTEKCFACGSPMLPTEESRGLDPTAPRDRPEPFSAPTAPTTAGGAPFGDDPGWGGARPYDGPERSAGAGDRETDRWVPMSDGPPDADRPPGEGPFRAEAGYGYGQGYGGYGTGYGLPPAYGAPNQGYGYLTPQQEKGATTALVLGIVSLVCCGVLLGPAAIIEGRKARRRIAESNGLLTGDGLALAGMVLGGVGFAISVIGIIVQIVVLSAPPRPRRF